MSQPLLIDRIIKSIPSILIDRSAKTPACSGTILTKYIDGEKCKETCHFRSVHQCTRFCNDSKHSHEQAVKWIIRYLLSTTWNNRTRNTKHQSILFWPDPLRIIDTFVDASFAGDWSTTWSNEPYSVISRTGYTILYINFHIIWCSKLQTEEVLSMTESKCTALSQSLRNTIPLIELLKEFKASSLTLVLTLQSIIKFWKQQRMYIFSECF